MIRRETVSRLLYVSNLSFSCCLLPVICILYVIKYLNSRQSSIFTLPYYSLFLILFFVFGGTLFIAIIQLKKIVLNWFVCMYISCGLNIYGLVVHAIYVTFTIWFVPLARLLTSGICVCIETLHTILMFNYANNTHYAEVYAVRLALVSCLFIDEMVQFIESPAIIYSNQANYRYMLIEASIVYAVVIIGTSAALKSLFMLVTGSIVLLSWTLSYSTDSTLYLVLIIESIISIVSLCVISIYYCARFWKRGRSIRSGRETSNIIGL